ncbi:unnamed protein product [Amoebophrya sp. A120]|nr:unnamed protein product [Amoebophrya sp. A120]|eukprot:GSA120T00024985001.1
MQKMTTTATISFTASVQRFVVVCSVILAAATLATTTTSGDTDASSKVANHDEQDSSSAAQHYCDSIGCNQPRFSNGKEFRLMGLFWAAQRRYLDRTAESVCEAVHRKSVPTRIGYENDEQSESVPVEVDGQTLNTTAVSHFWHQLQRLIRTPGFAQIAAVPSVRVAFAESGIEPTRHDGGTSTTPPIVSSRTNTDAEEENFLSGGVKQQAGAAAVATEDEQFSSDKHHHQQALAPTKGTFFAPDHLVFGSYGSLYSITLIAKVLKQDDQCLSSLQLLAEGNEKAAGSAQYQCGFPEALQVRDLLVEGDEVNESKKRQYPKVVATLDITTGGTTSGTSLSTILQTQHGEQNFVLSLLGATLYESGQLEVAIFLAADPATSTCVLVDGQRTFSSIPASYFSEWACEVLDEAANTSSRVKAAVVSYSSAVVTLACGLLPLPMKEATSFDTSATALFKSVRIRTRSMGSDWIVAVPLVTQLKNTAVSSRIAGDLNHATFPTTGPAYENNYPTRGDHHAYYPRTLTVCSQVLYGLDTPHATELMQQWFAYHEAIGIKHFYLYDRDGSLWDFVEKMRQDPQNGIGITYFDNFSDRFLSPSHHVVQQQNKPGLPSHAAPDAAAAAHCVFANRGLSEFVLMLHSPDEYLSNSNGLRHVEEVLQPLRQQKIDICDVSQVYFVNQTRQSPTLLGRYTNRADKPLLQPKGWGSAQFANSFLNRFGSPILRPEAVSELVAAHYPRGNNLFFPARVLDETPQTFVRANHYGHAFSLRNPLDESDVLVQDDSALWAEEIVAKRIFEQRNEL